jgi:class 3 adenylate cyclase
LAAILAADVVGYSRMMAADEAGTLARLRAARRDVVDPLMAEFKGRVFKVMGDGLIARFLPEARKEPGVELVTVNRSVTDPAEFLFYEVFSDVLMLAQASASPSRARHVTVNASLPF